MHNGTARKSGQRQLLCTSIYLRGRSGCEDHFHKDALDTERYQYSHMNL